MKKSLQAVAVLFAANVAFAEPPGAGAPGATPGGAAAQASAPTGAAPASAGAAASTPTNATRAQMDNKGHFYVYADKGAKVNHFTPSGWMGDYGDIRIDDASKDNPKNGTHCFKVTYSGKAAQGAGWAGIFWQHPANNWGNKPGGFDLSKAKKLTFWARGAQGNEKIAEFKVGGITGENADSDSASVGPVQLTKEWKQYTIDLTGKNFTNVIGGFAWAASRDDNPQGFVIYLDDVRFES
jgi:hypothetical protein